MHFLLLDNLSFHSNRSFIGELDGIDDQVDEYLLQPFPIRVYDEGIFEAHYRFQFEISRLRLELAHCESLIDEVVN